MRYIRRVMISHTLCDENIKDEDKVKSIFSSLKEKGLIFNMQVSGLPRYESVRVMSVDDYSIRVKIKQNSATLTKDFFYSDITSIAVETHPDKMFKINPSKSTRWNSLDLSDDWIEDVEF